MIFHSINLQYQFISVLLVTGHRTIPYKPRVKILLLLFGESAFIHFTIFTKINAADHGKTGQ